MIPALLLGALAGGVLVIGLTLLTLDSTRRVLARLL